MPPGLYTPNRKTPPAELAACRDCPRCGGRPRLITEYVHRRPYVRKDGTSLPDKTRRQAWCAGCGRPYTPAGQTRRRVADMTLDERLARYLALWPRWEANAPDRLRGQGWGGTEAGETSIVIRHRDGGRCQIPGPDGALCLAPATQIDHITPRNAGGALFDPANLRAACRPCNLALRRSPVAAMAAARVAVVSTA